MVPTMNVASAAASPVPSEMMAFAALLFISIGVLLVLRHYIPLRSTPASYLIPIFFSLWLPAGIVLLVPIDLASSARTEDEAARGVWLPDNLLLAAWKVTYWLTFALTWLILPVLGEYSDAGYRDAGDKLMHSLRENFRYYAMAASAGLIGLVYIFLSYGVSPTALKGLVMALAYCWGLVLAIYLMGHGLVSIPRSLIRNGSISGKLRRLQSQAPRLHEQMEDAVLTLEEIEMQISDLSRRKAGSAGKFRDWIEELVEIANVSTTAEPASPTWSRRAGRIGPPEVAWSPPTVITEKYLAGLTRRLVRAKQTRSRLVSQWHRLVGDASRAQAILDSAPSKRLIFETASLSQDGDYGDYDAWWAWARVWRTRAPMLTPYTRHLLHYRVVPAARVMLGFVLATASACIVWSELVRVMLPGLSVIRPSVVHRWVEGRGEVGFGGQVVAALWITYMCTAALSSVTEVRAWRGRVLARRNTAHEAAFWYAANVARLSIPLSYNFMTLLSPDMYTRTIFYDFLGRLVNLTPLGHWFDVLFPVLILVPVSATLFGLYGRAKRMLGLDVDMVDSDAVMVAWHEGRDLIERELGGGGGNPTTRSSNPSRAIRTAPVLSVPRPPPPPPPRQSQQSPPSTGVVPLLSNRNRWTLSSSSSSSRHAGSSTNNHDPARWLGRQQQQQQQQQQDDDNENDENFLQVLGHRMMNTVDTLGTPKWLRDVGRTISKPKWMGDRTDDDRDNGNRQSLLPSSSAALPPSDSSSSPTRNLRSWFGGSGRIQI